MKAYKESFHPQASVKFWGKFPARLWGKDKEKLIVLPLENFIESQKRNLFKNSDIIKEEPLEIEILGDSMGATARVRWKLFKRDKEADGMDYFTLVKTNSGWKITNLLFYGNF